MTVYQSLPGNDIDDNRDGVVFDEEILYDGELTKGLRKNKFPILDAPFRELIFARTLILFFYRTERSPYWQRSETNRAMVRRGTTDPPAQKQSHDH